MVLKNPNVNREERIRQLHDIKRRKDYFKSRKFTLSRRKYTAANGNEESPNNITTVQSSVNAAQGVMSTYKGRALGSIGDFGCYSFHETKNYSMGEGGALVIRDADAAEKAEIIREKGTDRSRFLRGQIDKYTWVDMGSSYLPSDINAAYLYAQLEQADMINQNRRASWDAYYEQLTPLAEQGRIELPVIPAECEHNAHMFYIKVKDLEERTALSAYLRENGAGAVFHYVPLHSSPAGKKFGRMHGEDKYTTVTYERLLRLPMYYNLEPADLEHVCDTIKDFYKNK